MQTRPSLALAAVLALACRSGPPTHTRGLSVASTTPPSSLLRLPVAGGPAELYHLPRLNNWGWRTSTPLPPIRRAIGADLDVGMVYALGAKNEIIALDLQAARPRPQPLATARDVAIGPDGSLFTVDDSLRVVQFVRRNPVRFPAKLPTRPRDLFGSRSGASGSALLAISAGTTNALTVLKAEEPPVRASLPNGDAAATLWGDLIAIAADTSVILVNPDAPETPVDLPVIGHARAVLFSPSGHRFYVARREGSVQVYNRFNRRQIGEIKLPGTAGSLRADPYGRWLLVHPPGADSLWLVDLAKNQYVGGFATDWAADLPTVTNQQTLLVKAGRDVVAYDLTKPDYPETGRVRGGAEDAWLPARLDPGDRHRNFAADGGGRHDARDQRRGQHRPPACTCRSRARRTAVGQPSWRVSSNSRVYRRRCSTPAPAKTVSVWYSDRTPAARPLKPPAAGWGGPISSINPIVEQGPHA